MQVPREALEVHRRNFPFHLLPQVSDFVKNALPKKVGEGQRILDVGAGALMLWKMLRSYRPRVVFADYAQYPDAFRAQRATTDAGKLPFRKDSFHFVVSTFSLEQMGRDAAVEEMHRVLARNGKLILLLHHPESKIVEDSRKAFEAIKALRSVYERLSQGSISQGAFEKADENMTRIYGRIFRVSKMSQEQLGGAVYVFGERMEDVMQNIEFGLAHSLVSARVLAEGLKDGIQREETIKLAREELDRLNSLQKGVGALGGENNGVFKNEEEIKALLAKHGFIPNRIKVEPLSYYHAGGHVKAFGVVAEKPD